MAHQQRQRGQPGALQPDGSLTPGFRKDVYCDDRLLNDPRFPKEAMKANCDNIDQPDSYVYPANFRLLQPGAVQEVLNKYLNDIADLQAGAHAGDHEADDPGDPGRPGHAPAVGPVKFSRGAGSAGRRYCPIKNLNTTPGYALTQ